MSTMTQLALLGVSVAIACLACWTGWYRHQMAGRSTDTEGTTSAVTAVSDATDALRVLDDTARQRRDILLTTGVSRASARQLLAEAENVGAKARDLAERSVTDAEEATANADTPRSGRSLPPPGSVVIGAVLLLGLVLPALALLAA